MTVDDQTAAGLVSCRANFAAADRRTKERIVRALETQETLRQKKKWSDRDFHRVNVALAFEEDRIHFSMAHLFDDGIAMLALEFRAVLDGHETQVAA